MLIQCGYGPMRCLDNACIAAVSSRVTLEAGVLHGYFVVVLHGGVNDRRQLFSLGGRHVEKPTALHLLWPFCGKEECKHLALEKFIVKGVEICT